MPLYPASNTPAPPAAETTAALMLSGGGARAAYQVGVLEAISELRQLCGGGVFQMPANISVMRDSELARQFQTYWQTPQTDAVTRMKLFKLAWDMVGSEFAGRHQQYEKFYAGASFIVRNHSFRETDWAAFNRIVENLMASYDYDGAARIAAE